MVQFLMKNKEIGLLGIMQVLIFIVLAFGQWHKTSAVSYTHLTLPTTPYV